MCLQRKIINLIQSYKIGKLTACHQAVASVKVTSMQHECYKKRDALVRH